MKLLRIGAAVMVALAAVAPIGAQVITPVELSGPEAQRLQQRHLQTPDGNRY
jgi:hypothetical protein